MDIRIKEPLYILSQGQEYVIRPGTVGVEKNRVVFFYDTTRTSAVGFSRDFCIENPQTFQVAKTLADKDISMRDVLRIIDESNLSSEQTEELYQRIKSLT